MRDMRLKAMLAAPGALFAAYLWLLLYVILSVPLWVTFVASGALLVAFTLAAATARGSAPPADPRRGDIVVGDDGVVMTYCIYAAPDEKAIRDHAADLGDHRIESVHEIAGDVTPADFPAPAAATG